jgi:predicted double-glycine peptidase
MHKRVRTSLLGCALVVAAASFSPAFAGSVPVDSGGTFNVAVTSFKEMRFLRVVRQQYDFSCGSAAVATLLTYHYNRPTREDAVLEAMMKHGNPEKIRKEGFSLLDMKRYLDSLGLDAEGYKLPLDKIAEAQVPGIVLIKTNGYAHFVVLKGMRDGLVVLGDPALGARFMPRERFQEIWNGIFFVIVSNWRNAKAAFNMPADWRTYVRAPLGSIVTSAGLGSMTLLMGPRVGF